MSESIETLAKACEDAQAKLTSLRSENVRLANAIAANERDVTAASTAVREANARLLRALRVDFNGSASVGPEGG